MAAAAVQVRIQPEELEVRVAKAILVVEDEPFVSHVTCDVLAQHGYSVLWARNSMEAKKIFFRHSEQIAVVLCDAVLPDGNGVMLAQSFRRHAPTLKLILASGYPPWLLPNVFEQRPGERFLSKPYSSAGLIAVVKDLASGASRAALGCFAQW